MKQIHEPVSSMSYSQYSRTVKVNQGVYLNTSEVCKLIKVSHVTLWRWRKNGVIPFIKYGRKVLYKLSDVEAFINQNYIDYGSR